jgi:hypothetical protein
MSSKAHHNFNKLARIKRGRVRLCMLLHYSVKQYQSPMSRVSRTFSSEENCRKRYENGEGMFNGYATLDALMNQGDSFG